MAGHPPPQGGSTRLPRPVLNPPHAVNATMGTGIVPVLSRVRPVVEEEALPAGFLSGGPGFFIGPGWSTPLGAERTRHQRININ